MDYKKRIIADFKIMLGKPVIKGTRITVEIILRKLSEGAGIDDLLKMYPGIVEDDIMSCLLYAADVIAGEEVVGLEKAS